MWPHLATHWIAFQELTTERQIGMGLGSIPVSKIKAYGRAELGLRDDGLDRFVSIIRGMDDEYLTAAHAKSSADPTQQGSEIPIDDASGVIAMFNRIETRNRNERKQAQAKAAKQR